MRLELLAQGDGRGEQGCPSIHRDHDDDGEACFVVRGEGIVVTPRPGPSRAAVRVDATVVACALVELGVGVPGGVGAYFGANLVVTGVEVDVPFLPESRPGQRAVRTTLLWLLDGLVQVRINRMAAASEQS
jgi:hypothetical protein